MKEEVIILKVFIALNLNTCACVSNHLPFILTVRLLLYLTVYGNNDLSKVQVSEDQMPFTMQELLLLTDPSIGLTVSPRYMSKLTLGMK